MMKGFKLSPLVVVGLILFLAAGELLAGTGLFFVAMMALAMLAICTTYNMLGGLSTIGGVAFAAFALGTMVVGQVSKVLMFEAADLNLRGPELTISVYAVFFLSMMVGVFLFGWIRLALPRPLEPQTSGHSRLLYALSVVIGFAAQVYVTNLVLKHPEQATSTAHGFGRAAAMLLPLSLVIAVDSRIRETEGRACFGWTVLLPALAMEFLGFIAASRSAYMMPAALVFLTGYFRGFKFRARHWTAAAAILAIFALFVSPWYLWSRSWRHQSSLKEQLITMTQLLEHAPSHWQQVKDSLAAGKVISAKHGTQYFSEDGVSILNRVVLIPEDDGIINACAHWHWGLETFRIDILDGIPHFILPHKPDRDATWFRASVGGLQSSYGKSSAITSSTISDAWGAFGWPSLIGVGLVFMPWLYVIYDSIFDMRRPWGTVAVVTLAMTGISGGVGKMLMDFMLQLPIYILLISWFIGWITRHIPMTGDSSIRRTGLLRPEPIRSATAGD